jgi:cytochrome c-type biogenesis protein CcmH
MRSRAVIAVLFLLALVACASEPDPSEVASRVSQEVMSPFCDGLTIHDCPSQQSEELRFEILQMAQRGMTADAIVDDLVARYGERIRGVPEPEGTGLVLWVLPAVAVALGIAVALLLARRFSGRRDGATDEQMPAPTSEERARLDAELAAARERT